jgi:hypothetical protein
MPELELTRSREDRKLYVLNGVGTLRLHGWMSRTATAEAEGRSWELGRRGIFASVFEATDASGTTAGEFRGRTLRRGGTLQWGTRELELRPASAWRSRYALAHSERELAIFDGKGWGKRPVAVIIDDPSAIDPGLVLFAAFIVRGLAEDASSAAAGGASVAASSAAVG